MEQTDKVILWLYNDGELRTINRHEAMNELFIYNLPEVVRKLRHKHGLDVPCIVPEGKRHGFYKLSKDDRAYIEGGARN